MTVFVPGIEEKDLKKINLSLQQLAAGRSNANGIVTLATSGTTTTVTPTQKGSIAQASTVLLEAMTIGAAAERAAGTMFISSIGSDTFTITHSVSAASRIFRYAVQG